MNEAGNAVWNFSWLTPIRCRLIFALLVVYNFCSGWRFLIHNCPIDLSGDEAQYWTWSRQLDLSYYSKGPLIAYIIRGSCALLGNTMPAVRLPALILAVGTSLCSYWLARKLFKSDRLALGTFLLGGVVPMYLAGATLMTIDPPFFFCWALATCLLAKAILDGSRWVWPIIGIVVGLGFLAKYAMFLWLPICTLFLLIDLPSRRWLGTIWPWLAVIIALLFTTPVILWNMQHHWVSLRHVATQTDTGSGNFLEFIGAQIGIFNPALVLLMVGAIVYAMGAEGKADPHRRAMQYLLCIGAPFFLICLLDSLRTKVQPNWPAPAYFTLVILSAHFISTCLADLRRWRIWRGWIYGAVIFGLLVRPILSDATVFYPLINRLHLKPNAIDPVFKLRGIADPFASTVAGYLRQMPSDTFVLCEDYMDASQLSFYLPGQPKTYFAGSYWNDPIGRRRLTQYDMWPDRQLDRPELINKDAIYIGTMHYEPLRQSFESVEQLPDIVISRRGFAIRSFTVWRCHGFKGMHRPVNSVSF